MSAPERKPKPKQSAAQARAEMQARQGSERAERRRSLEAAFAGPLPGRWIIVASWAGTILFTVTSVVGAIVFRNTPTTVAQQVAAMVALGLFGLGCVGFVAAIVAGGQRSRTSMMGIGGWFLLVGSAPRRAQWLLSGSTATQVAVGIATAAARLFTTLAFGTLVWVYGLALSGIWGARYGRFPDRPDDRR